MAGKARFQVNDLISVIVSTYDRQDALDVVLRALARQSDRNFEVVVADDGSGPGTARVVREWADRQAVPIRHVWHEDRGFRLAEIRNRGVRASSGAYIVFLDGDCIARRGFVAAHRRLAERGWFVTGTRVLLSRALTERILDCRLEPELWGFSSLMAARMRRHLNRIAPLAALRLGPVRKLSAQRWRGARGSNMGFWRADLEKVGGFDASFSGWGREDSDVFIRLIRAGVRRKDGRFASCVLHMWHAEADRGRLADNDRQLSEVLHSTRIAARRGLPEVGGLSEPAGASLPGSAFAGGGADIDGFVAVGWDGEGAGKGGR
jgi:glycosyltransferase involved in cell wall biosynthesis